MFVPAPRSLNLTREGGNGCICKRRKAAQVAKDRIPLSKERSTWRRHTSYSCQMQTAESLVATLAKVWLVHVSLPPQKASKAGQHFLGVEKKHTEDRPGAQSVLRLRRSPCPITTSPHSPDSPDSQMGLVLSRTYSVHAFLLFLVSTSLLA